MFEGGKRTGMVFLGGNGAGMMVVLVVVVVVLVVVVLGVVVLAVFVRYTWRWVHVY